MRYVNKTDKIINPYIFDNAGVAVEYRGIDSLLLRTFE